MSPVDQVFGGELRERLINCLKNLVLHSMEVENGILEGAGWKNGCVAGIFLDGYSLFHPLKTVHLSQMAD